MEWRYNIVDAEDLNVTKVLLERRMNPSRDVTNTVTIRGRTAKPDDTGPK
jgi:hypothetical protein